MSDCKFETLVRSDICEVSYCSDCGSVDLQLGNMTLHLTGRQFEQLAGSFRKAIKSKLEKDTSKHSKPEHFGKVLH